MADNRKDDINKRTNKIAQSSMKEGQEFEQLQSAQNQLLQIQAARQQNLKEQSIIDNSISMQNQTLAEAAEVGAMSLGVNQATQGVFNKYGLTRPVTTSTSKQSQTITRQNITINNNTTNITNSVPADIGGPVQGRGIQFKSPANDGQGGMSKFRDWLSKTFQKQAEETRKRNIEYQRRETSLTKSSNKIMRKLEEFGNTITKRLDPRRITNSLGDGLKRVLMIFGLGYIAKNTTKILDGINYIQKAGEGLFNWIKGGEKPKFIKDISNSLGLLIFGKDNFDKKGFKDKGILYGFYNENGTGILNTFFNKISDKFNENASLAKQYSGIDKLSELIPLMKDKNYGAALSKALGILTNYIGIMLGGKAGVARAINAEINEKGNNLGEDNDEMKTTANSIYKNVKYNGVDIGSAGASAYVTNGNGNKGSYNIDNGKRSKKYGDRAAARLMAGTVSNGVLADSNLATMGVFSDLSSAFVDKDKKGAAETAIDDLRMIDQYLNTHDKPMVADLNTIRGLTGNSNIQGVTYIPVARDWTYMEKYPNEVAVNHIASNAVKAGQAKIGGKALMAAGGAIGTAGAVAATTSVAIGATSAGFAAGEAATLAVTGGLLPSLGLAAGSAAIYGWIPVVGWIAFGCVAVGALAYYLSSPKVMAAGAAITESVRAKARAALEKEKIIDFVRCDIASMKKFWAIYGDYFVLTSIAGMNDQSLRGKIVGVTGDKGEYILVSPDISKVDDLIESAETIPIGENGGVAVTFRVRKDWMSLFNDRQLNEIINLVKQKKVQSVQLAEVTKEIYEQMKTSWGLSSPYYNSDNVDELGRFATTYFEGEGNTGVLNRLGNITKASTELERDIVDNLQSTKGSVNKLTLGDKSFSTKVKAGIREGTIGKQYHKDGSETSIEFSDDGIMATNTSSSSSSSTGAGVSLTSASGEGHTGSGDFVGSGLTDVVIPSPFNSGPRKSGKVSKITIHHMAGVGTAESCGKIFITPGRNASSNYGIGNDGRVGLYVPENWRAWTSSNRENDDVAVTIEVSNSATGDPWPISEAAYEKLILLCADICKRNNIPRVNYTGRPDGIITTHRMFARTACPGPTIMKLLEDGTIVNDINKAISGGAIIAPKHITDCTWTSGGDGTGSGCSGDGGILSFAEKLLSNVWESTITYTKKAANGAISTFIGTENYIKGITDDRSPLSSHTIKPWDTLSGGTQTALQKYYGYGSAGPGSSGYIPSTSFSGGGLDYARARMTDGNSLNSKTQRILSTLFTSDGKLAIDTSGLNPVLKESLEKIQAQLQEQTDLNKSELELNASIADSEMAMTDANTHATLQAMRGLMMNGNNTSYAPSANSDI